MDKFVDARNRSTVREAETFLKIEPRSQFFKLLVLFIYKESPLYSTNREKSTQTNGNYLLPVNSTFRKFSDSVGDKNTYGLQT